MRIFAFVILLLIYSTVQAQTIATSVTLGLGDSTRLNSLLLNLGKTYENDPSDPNLTIIKTRFQSTDNAVSIQCRKSIKGVELGTTCTVHMNSRLSQPGVTEVSRGVIGNVMVAFVKNPDDAAKLKKSVTSTVGYFQSQALTEIRFPDGALRNLPKFKIDCTSSAHSLCDLYLFPEP